MANKIYNEDWLAEEIKKTWGEFGAHYDVYKEVLKRAKASQNLKPEITKTYIKNKSIETINYLSNDKVYMTIQKSGETRERIVTINHCPNCEKKLSTTAQLLPISIFSLHCTKCNFDLLNPLK